MSRILSIIAALILVISVLPIGSSADKSAPTAASTPSLHAEGAFDTDIEENTDVPSLTDTCVDILEGKKDDEKDDENDEAETESERDVIPDDGFEGEYKDFPGKNGITTRVYDNGSIVTVYPDGSREGMDYNGNRYTENKDGKQVIYDIEGNQHIKNSDGSEEAISAGGTHMYYNEDGSYRAVTVTGTVFEYDKNDDPVAISIEGGESLSLLDEEGYFIKGEYVITGPDGKKFTFVNKENEDGGQDQFKFWSEGNGQEFGFDGKGLDNDEGFSVILKKPDGVTAEITQTIKDNGDGTASASLDMFFTHPDGSWFKGEGNVNSYTDGTMDFNLKTISQEGEVKTGASVELKFGPDEEITSAVFKNDDGSSFSFGKNGDEAYFTASDGTFFKTNNTTGAAEYYDPESGDHIKINDQGEVEIYQIGGDDGSTLNYENGQFVIKDRDGSVVTVIEKNEETGDTTVTTETGDSYTITKDGKVLKNGKEVKEDHSEEASSGDSIPSDWGDNLLPADVEGTYELGGSGVQTEYEDLDGVMVTQEEVVTDLSATMTVKTAFDDKVSIEITGDVNYSGEFRLNPNGMVETGREDITIRFLRIDGMSVSLFWDVDDLYGAFAGTRK